MDNWVLILIFPDKSWPANMSMQNPPAYRRLHANGELKKRSREAISRLGECRLCPRRCGINRLEDESCGFCRTGRLARVSGFDLHFGEEAPLVGESGSGTIFFSGCNLGCEFCQNWEISRDLETSVPGTAVTSEQLAWIMLELQKRGALNINLVTPSHVIPQILEALLLAADCGLNLPLVYNSSGYDVPESLNLLDGIVDMYMPDTKIWDPDRAKRYLNARDYPQAARKALKRMHKQVGDLETDESGIARKGLLVRHLVLPENAAGTRQWMHFLAGLSKDTYVNVMGQYHPCGRADKYPELSRTVTGGEVEKAKAEAARAGLSRLDKRESGLIRELLRKL